MTDRVVPAARLDLTASMALAADLADRRGKDVAIDLSAVTHLGAHAAQTLLAARHSWSADGRTLFITSPSPEALSDWTDLGLEPETLQNGDLR